MIQVLQSGLSTLKGMNLGTWIAGGLTSVLAVLLPSNFVLTLVLTVGALLVLDTVTGMLAARRKGVKISSAKFGRLGDKMLGTAVLWITLALLGNVMGVMLGAPKLAEILIAGGIGATCLKEGLSILENLMRLGIYVPKSIKKKLRDWLGEIDDKD